MEDVLVPGAGVSRRTPMLVELGEALAGSGARPSSTTSRARSAAESAPDPPAVLEATARAAAAFAVARTGASRLVLGGRSMGGRIASLAVARGQRAEGLAFLAYPLHPPGREDQLRDAHLVRLDLPMLFVQGTRDAFAREELLHRVITRLGVRATLHQVEGADHSFAVRRRSGRTAPHVLNEVREALLGWLGRQGL
jgi:predicted alpha/beta-hydrolase family hydrolase